MISVSRVQPQLIFLAILINTYAALRGGFKTMATKKQTKVQLGVLIYKDQMKLIDAKAKQIGLSRSAYIRHVVLKSLEK